MVHYLTRPSTLAERLRCKRREKGWSQEQLAAAAGHKQTGIQKIENGYSLRPRRINEIAEALGVSPSWLIYGEESEAQLDAEVREVAKAWSQLSEPHRSSIREKILYYAGAISSRK